MYLNLQSSEHVKEADWLQVVTRMNGSARQLNSGVTLCQLHRRLHTRHVTTTYRQRRCAADSVSNQPEYYYQILQYDIIQCLYYISAYISYIIPRQQQMQSHWWLSVTNMQQYNNYTSVFSAYIWNYIKLKWSVDRLKRGYALPI